MIVLSFLSPLLSFIRFCYYALLYIIGFPWKYIIENHSISISSSPPHPSLFSSLKHHTNKEYRIKSIMLSSPLELTLIKMFASSIKAKNALDIGCFTGYSALYLYFSLYSRSLSDPPSVLTIDNDHTRIGEAENFFNQIDPKKSVIKTIVGDALTVLKKLETEEYAKELYYWNQLIHNNNNNNNSNNKQEKNDHDNDDDHQIDYSNDFYRFVGSHGQPPFDIIYLDADKVHYPLYYQLLLDKHYLSPNGYLFIDNVLLFTAFTAPWPKFFGGNNAEGIMNLNQLIKNDKRVEIVLLPFRDGLAIIKWSLSHLQSCSICLKRSYHDNNNNINKNNHHYSMHRSMNGNNNNNNNKKNIRTLNGNNNDNHHMNSVSLNGDMIPFAYRSSSSTASFIHQA